MLKEFRDLDFIKKIEILTTIQNEKKTEYIPDLFELYNTPTGDDSIDNIIEETLKNVVSLDEVQLREKLRNGNQKEKIFCIKTAARFKINSAVPDLSAIVKEDLDDKTRYQILYALSEIKDRNSLPIFRSHIGYPDTIISALAIEMIGFFKDEESIVRLIGIINDAESEENYKRCSVETADSIDALSEFDSKEVLSFLVKKIHHKNPTARRIIHENLAAKGTASFPFLKKVFLGSNNDIKIMAANIIGRIGDKSGCEILISVLDSQKVSDSNLRYAIFEALGELKSLKGLIFLSEALGETEFLVLMAVVHAINGQVNKKIIEQMVDMIKVNDQQSGNLIKAIVHTKSDRIFKEIYKSEPEIADQLITHIIECNDEEIVDIFKGIIRELDLDRMAVDLEKIEQTSTIKSGINILAADDSKAMLMFYRNLSAETGFHIVTVENGSEALERLHQDNDFSLIITDMNMPVMDGIELTRKIKMDDHLKHIPVLMATTESDSSQIDIARDSGVDQFIQKPFTLEFLFEKAIQFLT